MDLQRRQRFGIVAHSHLVGFPDIKCVEGLAFTSHEHIQGLAEAGAARATHAAPAPDTRFPTHSQPLPIGSCAVVTAAEARKLILHNSTAVLVSHQALHLIVSGSWRHPPMRVVPRHQRWRQSWWSCTHSRQWCPILALGNLVVKLRSCIPCEINTQAIHEDIVWHAEICTPSCTRVATTPYARLTM